MNDKFSLRRTIYAHLKQVDPLDLDRASMAICQFLVSDLKSSSPTPTVALFSAHGKEVDLSALHTLLPSALFVYPLCHPRGILSFHSISSTHDLHPGTLGILEPDPGTHPEVDINEIDVFLCPGLAFGPDGARLGHGGGYYDRALAQRDPSAVTIGIGLEIQIQCQDVIPLNQHDIPLDFLLTEKGYHAKSCGNP